MAGVLVVRATYVAAAWHVPGFSQPLLDEADLFAG